MKGDVVNLAIVNEVVQRIKIDEKEVVLEVMIEIGIVNVNVNVNNENEKGKENGGEADLRTKNEVDLRTNVAVDQERDHDLEIEGKMIRFGTKIYFFLN